LKKYLINSAILFIGFIFLFIGCSCAKEQESAGLSVAPDFTLQDLNQAAFCLKDYKDKQQPVILFFWTTWCPYCRDELRILKDQYAKISMDGWALFAVNVGESADKVDSFIKSYSLPFKVLLDKTRSVAKSFDVPGVPTYVFIDRKGQILTTEHYFSEQLYEGLIQK
jgi:peroxiredoxin